MIIFKGHEDQERYLRTEKKANVIFKKNKEEDPGKYHLVSVTSIPGKVMESHSGGHLYPHKGKEDE